MALESKYTLFPFIPILPNQIDQRTWNTGPGPLHVLEGGESTFGAWEDRRQGLREGLEVGAAQEFLDLRTDRPAPFVAEDVFLEATPDLRVEEERGLDLLFHGYTVCRTSVNSCRSGPDRAAACQRLTGFPLGASWRWKYSSGPCSIK